LAKLKYSRFFLEFCLTLLTTIITNYLKKRRAHMKYSIKRFISGLLTMSTALTLSGIGMLASAHAGTLYQATDTLSNDVGSSVSTHSIAFKIPSNSAIAGIKIQFSITASGVVNTPQGLSTIGTTPVLVIASTTSSWTPNVATNGTISMTGTSTTPTTGSLVNLTLPNVTNNYSSGVNLTTPCDSIPNSESCFVRITTYADTGLTTPVDTTTVTYTVVDAVTVTATVDPILSFTVSGVPATSTLDPAVVYPSGNGDDVTSTATTIPFGNVTINKAKVAQQQLFVLTNANNGYSVYAKFTNPNGSPSTISGGGVMVGAISPNNIVAPFKAGTATFASPVLWTAPTGSTANSNSAWLGIRTYSTGISSFNGSDLYSAPYTGSNIGDTVMTLGGPDNGTSGAVVTLKIQANAYQPADSYTGTMVYNVVASY
jgi:hypothetical protein